MNAAQVSDNAQAAAVLDKLEARQEARKAEREQRQQQLKRVADPREDIDHFLASFSIDQSSLQRQLNEVEQLAAVVGHKQDEKQTIVQQLEGLCVAASSLEKRTSDATYFLPPYELRSCSNQLQQLRAQMAAIKQQLQPKRKFAFSKAVKKADVTASAAMHALPDGTAAADQTAGNSAVQTHPQSQQTTSGLCNETIVKTAEQLAGQAYALHNLSDCTVYLLGHLTALRLQDLHNCKVYTGPVTGSTFVNGATNCTLMLASHQVRIHNAKSCDCYLRVKSRPVIEHSSALRFAPYAVDTLIRLQQQQQQEGSSGNLQMLFEQGQLLENTDLWQHVDDFGWVKAAQSPHWSVLPENERQEPAVPAMVQQ